MKNLLLYTVVFVSGASVLAVEILGTRILGPFYGVGLFLWSALISVTLAALSVGYAVGGYWADKGATVPRLCCLTAGAGIWLLLVPWLKYPILTLTEPFGLRLAVLVAASVLFAVPLTLLGMVSPYAIKLKTSRLEEVGRAAGNLYAISTIASVFSALLTGYFLVPNIGVNRLILCIGIVLLSISAIGLMQNKRPKAKASIAASLLLLAVAAIGLTPTAQAEPKTGLIAVEQSAYAEIRVLDMGSQRLLLIDGGAHTVADRATWRSSYPYAAVMERTKLFFEEPGRLLLIGLGGGSIAKAFENDGWTVDVVEIDPVVTWVAQEYFDLDSFEGRIFHQDGRQFFLSQKETYDIIMLDVFGSSSIPFHLVTRESFALAASRLKPDGVLAINAEAISPNDLIIRSLAATLSTHFPNLLAIPTMEPSEELGNVVLLASRKPLEAHRQPKRGHAARFWNRRFTPDIRDVPVLTDDLNPVDLWSEQINYVARKDLHSYFEETGASW